jgi:hypothetical protein
MDTHTRNEAGEGAIKGIGGKKLKPYMLPIGIDLQ